MSEGAFGRRVGAGARPALLVVDLIRAFTDPSSPLACDADYALAATARLVEAARRSGAPLIFTSTSYDAGGLESFSVFLTKVPALADLGPDSDATRVDRRTGICSGDVVLCKGGASAFFGTSLDRMLAGADVDTLVICGASTSGCVRATVVDALQRDLRALVPKEAVADRDAGAHDAALRDIDGRYGDVVALDDAIAVLST